MQLIIGTDRFPLSRHRETADFASRYRRLLSRRIDLVGDYAGNELFLIEGDSLLLHCFSDVELDFAGSSHQILLFLIFDHLSERC